MMRLLVTTLVALATVSAFASATNNCFNVSETFEVPQVDCSTNSISLSIADSKIRRGLMTSQSLRCLTIQDSAIQSVADGAFDQMTNLSYLNLQRNKLNQDKLFSFGNLTSVRTLILSNQNVSKYNNLTLGQVVYPQLERLEMRSVGVTGIVANWSDSFPALKLLDLSMNKFTPTSLPRSITHLSLNENQLKSLSLDDLGDLRVLEVDDNHFQVLGNGSSVGGLSLKGLRNLTRLSAVGNRIHTIYPEVFDEVPNLRYLNLSWNELYSLGHNNVSESLRSLDVLALDSNSLDELPFNSTMQLTTLSMNCNQLTQLSLRPMLNLPFLRKLYLGWNMIRTIHPFAFRLHIQLEELYLNDNQLSYLPPDWNNYLSNLRVLDLSGNQFYRLQSMFQSTPNPSLRYVYFERNPLKNIFVGALRNVPENMTVNLQEIPGRLNNPCFPRVTTPTTTETTTPTTTSTTTETTTSTTTETTTSTTTETTPSTTWTTTYRTTTSGWWWGR